MDYCDSIMDDINIKLGPLVFKMGKNKNAVLTCPAIWAFQGDIAHSLEQIDREPCDLSGTYMEHLYNSVLDDLVAAMLIYFENRLKVLAVRNDLGKMNSIPEAMRLYKKHGVDIDAMQTDISFLSEIDVLRGRKHHTAERYAPQEVVSGKRLDISSLRTTVEHLMNIVRDFDRELFDQNPDFKVEKTEDDFSIAISFTALNHSYDMTKNGKIVEKRPHAGGGPDPTNISFFQIQANYSEARKK